MAAGTDSRNPNTPIRIMPPAMLSTPEIRLVSRVARVSSRYVMGALLAKLTHSKSEWLE